MVHSKEELDLELKKYNSSDIYVIGGGSVYKMLLSECDTAHVTKINYAYEADTYFPNLDKMEEWKVTEESEEQTYFDICYTYVTYEKEA